MKAFWTMAPVLFLVACSSGPADRSRGEVEAVPESRSGAAAPVSSPAPAPSRPASAAGPDLSYAVLDTKKEGELPVRWVQAFSGTPQTRLEGGVLWAPAAPVVRILAPNARVTFEGGALKVDGKAVTAPARSENGEPWAAVVPLARHFGAYARVHPDDGSIAIWPRDVLLWMRDHGDPQAPVLREAKDAGLLGTGS